MRQEKGGRGARGVRKSIQYIKTLQINKHRNANISAEANEGVRLTTTNTHTKDSSTPGTVGGGMCAEERG